MNKRTAAKQNVATAPFAEAPGRSVTVVPPPADVTLSLERVGAPDLGRYAVAWDDLCRRTLEPNAFLDPAFALPLLRHASAARETFLLIWEDDGVASFGRLVGLFPIAGGWPLGLTARGWTHPQIACGTPLVDATRAEDVVERVLVWLADNSHRQALVLDAVPREGAFRTILDRVCSRTQRIVTDLSIYERAALHRGSGPPCAGWPGSSAKHRKDYARQVRRLSEIGARTYSTARRPAEIGPAIERFLALEAAGWKGARGTAFASTPALACFVRTMVQEMAAKGCCRIDALDVDGHPVAMGILLRCGDRDFFWKTAFDESLAKLSPGVQFATELQSVQLADPEIALTDSCAVADHPMIDRVWSDRLSLSDLMVSATPDSLLFGAALRLERFRRSGRRRAKGLWTRLRRLAR